MAVAQSPATNAADTAYVAGDYATAIENYQKAVEADPDQEYALYFLGHAYYNSGDLSLIHI